MLKKKLDSKTSAFVKARADFFFAEQVKRLGPLPCAVMDASPVISPVVAAAPRKRGRPRKTLTT